MLGGISQDVRTIAPRLRLRVEQIPESTERERAISDISDMVRLLDDVLLVSHTGAGEMTDELVEFDEIIRAGVEDRRSAGAVIDLRVNTDAVGAALCSNLSSASSTHAIGAPAALASGWQWFVPLSRPITESSRSEMPHREVCASAYGCLCSVNRTDSEACPRRSVERPLLAHLSSDR